MSLPARIPPELLAMMGRGVSVIVGSRSASMKPSIMRAVGSDVSADGKRVTVYLAQTQSSAVLDDLRTIGHIAVVFSQPATHRSVQLKATQVQLRPAEAADAPVLQRYAAAMDQELDRVGFPAAFNRTMLAYRLEDVVAVSFAPEQVFEQTPGPRAGARL